MGHPVERKYMITPYFPSPLPPNPHPHPHPPHCSFSPVTRMDATARAGFPPRRDAAGIPRDDITDRCVRVMLRRGVSPTAPAAAAVPKRDVIDDHTVLANNGLFVIFFAVYRPHAHSRRGGGGSKQGLVAVNFNFASVSEQAVHVRGSNGAKIAAKITQKPSGLTLQEQP